MDAQTSPPAGIPDTSTPDSGTADSRTPIGPRRAGPSTTFRTGVLVAVALITLIGIVVAAGWQAQQTSLPGRVESDLFTVVAQAALGFVATACALVALTRLIQVAAFTRRPSREAAHRLADRPQDAVESAGRWAAGWCVAALATAPFSAATSIGVPVSYVAYAPGDYVTSSQSAQAWLVTGAIAFLVAVAARFAHTWRAAVAMAGLVAVGGLPPVLTAQVSVGAGHDLATDAATILTLAISVWFATTWAAGRVWPDPAAVARYRRIAGVALVLSLVTRIGIGFFELVDEAPWESGYGLVAAGGLGVMIILALFWLVRLRRSSFGPGWDPALMIVVLGAQSALTAMVPPRYWWPQSAQENYLGFEVGGPPQAAEMLLPGRPNLLFATVAVIAIALYWWGYLRLRRRG